MPAKSRLDGGSRVTKHGQPRKPAAVASGPWWSTWLLLLPLVTVLPFYLCKLHYHLPDPKPAVDATGRPQPSEDIVLAHIGALEGIGYRTVGTHEAVAGEQYVADQVGLIKKRCDDNGVLKCEVWVQKGSGYHAVHDSFTIIDHDVLKLYSGITNVILKISSLQPPSGGHAEKDSVLLGSHVDSTLPSPGAADDGMGVGVMLDIARVLVDRNEPFDNSVIFKTLQDGSHMYSTQHETTNSVRAMINLEAAGSTGGALLFQATSKEMLEAYSHVPYPKGTVIAADVFASGILMSDTDFGQFEEYLNVSGLDMAIVGHSYYYHTHKDTLANIERGSAQHFTDNIMAVVDYLLSPESPLPHNNWSPPDMVYLSLYDRVFYMFPMENGTPYYIALAVVAAAVSVATFGGNLKPLIVALIGTPLGLVAGIVAANVLAIALCVVDKRMTWFSHEFLPILLYAPIAFLAHLGVQYLLAKLVAPTQRHMLEQAYYLAQTLYFTWYMILLHIFKVRSAYLMALLSGIMLAGATVSGAYKLARGAQGTPFVSAYVLPLFVLVTIGVEAVTLTLDIFVPLTGRMGKTAPTEYIIATITSAVSLTFAPVAAPLFHRLTRSHQRRVLAVLALTTLTVVAVFTSQWWSPYDATHPKRLLVQYTYNHSSHDHIAHLAFTDMPDNTDIAIDVASHFGGQHRLVHTALTSNDSDWDTLYPVSSFLDTFRFPVEPSQPDFKWPESTVKVSRKQLDEDTADLTLRFDFPGLVWPIFAFDAEILEWSFDFAPPKGRRRHHLRTATSVDDHYLDLELVVKLAPGEKVKIDWSAIDINQMVPGTASRLGPDMPASLWLTELDSWAADKYKGALDVCLSGVVVGILEV